MTVQDHARCLKCGMREHKPDQWCSAITYRAVFGWSNYQDFATEADAQDFISAWKRPASWGDDPLRNDPKLVVIR